MSKVIAIESFKDGLLREYGEGILVEDQIPDEPFFRQNEIVNPCIKLDTGKYIWGFQCWWAKTEVFNEKYGKYIKERQTVDVGDYEILPLSKAEGKNI